MRATSTSSVEELRSNERACIERSLRLPCLMMALLMITMDISAQTVEREQRLLDYFTTRSVHPDLAISDAIHIAESGRSIGVFGTRVAQESGGSASALLIAPSLGTTHVLTDSLSEPHAAVAIADVGGRCLVLWNDRRPDAPGIWGALCDYDGNVILSPRHVLNGYVLAGAMYGGSDADGFNLFVSLGTSHVASWSLRLDSTLTPVDNPSLVTGGAILRGRAFRLPTGEQFVPVIPFSNESVFLTSTGRVYPGPVATGRFSRPFVFDSPGSIITTETDSTLVRYDPINADVPRWRINGIGGRGIGRDSLGWYVVSYEVATETEAYMALVQVRYRVDTLSQRVSSIERDTIHRTDVDGPFYGGPEPIDLKVNIRTVAAGVQSIAISYCHTFLPVYPPDEVTICADTTFLLDSRSGSSGSPSYVLTQSRGNFDTLHSGVCLDYETSVGSWSRCISVLTALQTDPGPSDRPALRVDRGVLLAGGVVRGNELYAVRLRTGLDTAVTTLQPVRNSPIGFNHYSNLWRSGPYRTWGSSTTAYIERGIIDLKKYRTKAWFYSWSLSDSGWNARYVTGGDYPTQESSFSAMRMQTAYDPNLNERLFTSVLVKSYALGQSTSIVDYLHEPLEEGESYQSGFGLRPTTTEAFIPYDGGGLLAIRPGGEVFGLGTASKVTYTLPVENYDGFYVQRLLGERYLLGLISRNNATIDLQVRSLAGEVLHARKLRTTMGRGTIHNVLQSDADSMIVLLVDIGGGLQLRTFGPNLLPVSDSVGRLLAPVLIPSHSAPVEQVAADIHNDDLFVAWVDQRSNDRQIYLNRVRLPHARVWPGRHVEGSEEDPYDYWEQYEGIDPRVIRELTPEQRLERFGFALIGISPNPAFGQTSLRIGSRVSRGVWTTISDLAGRELFRLLIDVEPGVHEYPLPDLPLQSGLYGVSLETAGLREFGMFGYFPE